MRGREGGREGRLPEAYISLHNSGGRIGLSGVPPTIGLSEREQDRFVGSHTHIGVPPTIGLSGIPPTIPLIPSSLAHEPTILSSLAPAPPTRAGPDNAAFAAFSKSVPPRWDINSKP
jgi:hypothetical protein